MSLGPVVSAVGILRCRDLPQLRCTERRVEPILLGVRPFAGGTVRDVRGAQPTGKPSCGTCGSALPGTVATVDPAGTPRNGDVTKRRLITVLFADLTQLPTFSKATTRRMSTPS